MILQIVNIQNEKVGIYTYKTPKTNSRFLHVENTQSENERFCRYLNVEIIQNEHAGLYT